MIRELIQEFRISVRSLFKAPVFTLVTLIILALGIGATTSVLSVIDAVVLSALPFPEADRLVDLSSARRHEEAIEAVGLSYLDARDFAEQSDIFETLAVYSPAVSFNMMVEGEPSRASVELVAHEYFDLLGARPQLGRTFSEEEDSEPGDRRVAILSHAFWQSRFGGDMSIVGRSLMLNDETYQIIGVIEEGFYGLTDEGEVWLPINAAAQVYASWYINFRRLRWLDAVGRLAKGVSPEQAELALGAIAAGLEEEHPDMNKGIGVQVTPLMELWYGGLPSQLWMLLGASAFVLLIACSNVASLLLARARERQREMAICVAVGANRLRLIRRPLIESFILAVLACALGLLFGHWSTNFLVATSAMEFKSFIALGTDLELTLLILASSVATIFLFSLMPALFSSRLDPVLAMKEGGRGSMDTRRKNFQSMLVVAEIALAMVLLTGGSLMIRGFQNLRSTDLGFDSEGILTARIDLNGQQYPDTSTRRVFIQQLFAELNNVPGVETVSLEGPALPTDPGVLLSFTLEDRQDLPEMGVRLRIHHVTPEYFSMLGIPVLEGRTFTEEDHAEASWKVVISKALADRFWPGEDPIGKRLKPGRRDQDNPYSTVVGVVANVQHDGLTDGDQPHPDVYRAILQSPPGMQPSVNVLARGEGNALALVSGIKSALRGIAPTLPLFDVSTLQQRLDRQVSRDRFLVFLMNIFVIQALLIAAIGIFSVISYSVVMRSREIGIRMAFGAGNTAIIAMVFKRGITMALAGAAIGFASAVVLTRLLETRLAKVLHGVDALNVMNSVATLAIIILITAAACWIPTRRALGIQPTTILRID